MNAVLAGLSGLISLLAFLPYFKDILHGRVVLARSGRLMYVVLLIFVLFQQKSLGTGWSIVLTLSELIVCTIIFSLSFKYGVGGMSRLDLVCYLLLLMNLIIWKSTNNAFIGIHLSILGDAIASWPIIHKTFREPKSETPLFYWAGATASMLAIFAEENIAYSTIAFPLYLVLANAIIAGLTYRKCALITDNVANNAKQL